MENQPSENPANEAPPAVHQWIASGWQNYVFKRFPEAESDFRQALRLSDCLSDAYYGLGASLRSQNRIPEAIEAWKKAQECLEADATAADAGHRAILRQLLGAQISLLTGAPAKEA